MEDAIDEAFADDEDEEEEEMVLGAVFAELGVDLQSNLSEVPTAAVDVSASESGGVAVAAAAGGGGGGDAGGGGGGGDDLDAELQRRLDNLRRT